MTEPMSDERLERVAGLAELPCSCDNAGCGNYTSALTAVEARELVAEARRARADAARCQATNESDLYGIIRCDKPRDHRDDHEAQTDEAYSKWIRKEASLARQLREQVERAKRVEAELRKLADLNRDLVNEAVDATTRAETAERALAEHPDEWGVALTEGDTSTTSAGKREDVARRSVAADPEHRRLMHRRGASKWQEVPGAA